MLVQVAEWLIKKGKLSASDCPVIVTRGGNRKAKRCLVNSTPRHPAGHDFKSAVQLSNGLHVETHASRSDLEKYARALLKWAGIDDSVLVVE
jgi:hypothetical protein